MALTQGFEQPRAWHGPQWRQAPLNGVSMASAQLTGPGQQRPGTADGIQAAGGCTS